VLRDWLGEAKVKQVYLILRDRILTGAIASGAKLRTANELAEVHGVSRVTIRRALGELACERLIERRRSASTRVIYRGVLAPTIADISGMLASLADVGRHTAVTLTSFAHVPTEAAVAQALGVPSDQMLQRSELRSMDTGPLSHLTTYVPESISLTFTQQELASRPLSEVERARVKVEHARQRISASLAALDVAGAPSVRTGTPPIELTRAVLPSIWSRDRAPASAVPAGPLTFEFELVRSGTREIVVTHCALVEKWRHSFNDGLITRNKPPDVRAALGEGVYHVGS
jgi:GntR family transcriptional regulator